MVFAFHRLGRNSSNIRELFQIVSFEQPYTAKMKRAITSYSFSLNTETYYHQIDIPYASVMWTTDKQRIGSVVGRTKISRGSPFICLAKDKFSLQVEKTQTNQKNVRQDILRFSALMAPKQSRFLKETLWIDTKSRLFRGKTCNGFSCLDGCVGRGSNVDN